MIHRTAHFIVKADKIEEAKELINIFTSKVNEKENGCQLYRSLQNTSNDQEFLHYMIFENKAAEDLHRTTEYVKEFVDNLYPILEKQTEFTTYNVIAD